MSEKQPYWQVVVRLLCSLAATAVVILAGAWLMGFLMPFVIGWVISMIAAPMVNWLEKRLKIVKKLGSALIVIFVLSMIIGVLYLGISRLVQELIGIIQNFPEMYSQLEDGMGRIGDTLSVVFERFPESVQTAWHSIANDFSTYMGNLVSKISEPTVMAAGNLAKSVPRYLVSAIVVIMSSYFFTVQKEEVIAWFHRVSPASLSKRLRLVSDNLKYAVGGYVKAQFKIMGIVFLILAVGFAFLRTGYFVLIALLIAFLDFLPFFGTGTAMIPWAVYKLFMGDYKMAVALLIIYAITQVVRQILQPKLVGDSVGLNPLVTLLLLYVGYRMGGVLWMILSVPIGMVVINMCKAGAFDYIFEDIRILVDGVLGLWGEKRTEENPNAKR